MTRAPLISALGVAAAIPALTGCALRQTTSIDALQQQPAREFRGHYTVGNGSWFVPCGAPAADGAWWVTVTGLAASQTDRARRDGQLPANTPTFVRWRGVETSSGEVGPRGPGKPALLIREVVELRPRRDDDCR